MLFALTTVDVRAQTTTNGEFLLHAPAALVNEIAARHNLIVVRQLEGHDLFVVSEGSPVAPLTNRTTSGTTQNTQNQVTDIGGDPDIVTFEPNAIISTPEVALSLNGSVVSILDGVSDTSLTTYFDNQVWARYVDQPAATAIGLAASHTAVGTGAGVVAVIDTGVDPNHPALAGSLVPGYDFIHETAGIASEWTDIDGSVVSILDGSVVSILDGHAVTINGSVVAILDQATAAALDPSLLPHAFGHGTMVAGLVHLVAPTAQIMPLKAFNADGTSTVFDVVRAIYYAVDHGARVINMSFSATTPSPEITRAINYATGHGVICVASAGNLGQETVVYPGGLRNVVGVGSTSSTTPPTRSTFSNYGDALVSLGAPGEAVITTYPGAHFAAGWGTSFSAPLAAGAASLLLRVDPAVDPGKVADLLGKAQPMTAGGMGKGRLSLPDAVRGAADTVSPTVSLSSPTGGTLFGNVLISASASDNVGVAGVRFLLDGNPLGSEIAAAPFEQMWTTTAASNGSHVLTAIARDRSGNEATTVANVTVANDSGAPTAAVTSPAAGATLSGTVSLTASVSDDIGVASVTFLVDGAAAGVETPAGRFWNTTTAANGAHVVSVVARDVAGHETTASVEVTVRNDLQAPTVALTTPVEGATLGGLVSVLAAASDDIGVTGVQFKVDGALVGSEDIEAPYETLWNTAGASNGSHTVSAVARDSAGHETTTSVAVVVSNDSAPPTVAFLSPINGDSVAGSMALVATASDNVGVTSVQFLVDGVVAGAPDMGPPYHWSWDTEGAANGPHTVMAVARDAAGHETSTSVVVDVVNDQAPPTLALVSPPEGHVSGTVPLVATASDDVGVVSVEFLADGTIVGPAVTAAPYEWLWNSATVANGSHTIWALARDAAGHETLASLSVTVANDSGPPSVMLTNPVGAPTVTGTMLLAATASDDIGVVSVQFLVDGVLSGLPASNSPYEASWNTAGVSNGLHTVSAVARDAAGHATTASAVVTVANDTAAPTLVLTNPVNGSMVSSTVTLSAAVTDDVGVTSVEFLVDGAAASGPITAQPYQWGWATRQLDGVHTITAIARDAAGHETSTSVQVTIVEDNLPTP
ncbi:MAG TPA: Ig-like domain-containing protein [Vicinamibacterales bacterium]|nr:Ig-like domain-containing protein [Vicinamibacterales bacterium]